MTNKFRELDVDLLRSLISYDPVSGKCRWFARPVELFPDGRGITAAHACATWNSKYAGREINCTNDKGYITLTIFGRQYVLHRVIYAIVRGHWPTDEIDHKDGNPLNNRWLNLRDASHAQNMRNKKMPSNNTTGLKGVIKRDAKFTARISHDGRNIWLGTYDSAQEAHAAYDKAARLFFGEFARAS
jgi:hypothetical protein